MNFGKYVNKMTESGNLVLQPRMGVISPEKMRQGLLQVKRAKAATVGTITVDSYTRTKQLHLAEQAIRNNEPLNGYPISSHPINTSKSVIENVQNEMFPIQVRHGSALPEHIFKSIIDIGLDATEGGPISYCLPYGRVKLNKAIQAWRSCSEMVAEHSSSNYSVHIESFGGCMLGQLCPPSLLIAISVLECIFFETYGVKSMSLSYTQQTSTQQDTEALLAMRKLANEFLNQDTDWHIVLYAYMGVFPDTISGCNKLQKSAVQLAKNGQANRLIVKTIAEAQRIPTFKENIEALELSQSVWNSANNTNKADSNSNSNNDNVYLEAKTLILDTLNLHSDISQALLLTFGKGVLDVPFCLHPDNKNLSRSYIDGTGKLVWADNGKMNVKKITNRKNINHNDLMRMLTYKKLKFDGIFNK
jgi:methylaspartate mutase epsilon subunit